MSTMTLKPTNKKLIWQFQNKKTIKVDEKCLTFGMIIKIHNVAKMKLHDIPKKF